MSVQRGRGVRRPAVPDFLDYRRPGTYLVRLTEKGFSTWHVSDDGEVWDDEDNGRRTYPDLARDIRVILDRERAYKISEVASALDHE
jgi:hypothetical protein